MNWNQYFLLLLQQSVPQQTGTLKNIHISETEERMVLLQKLEKSEGRIMALEKQVCKIISIDNSLLLVFPWGNSLERD